MNKTQKKNNPQLKPFAPHRVRQVRPDLFKSETIADLSMTARFGFVGLMTCCDKNGRFEWKPRTLKSDIFPHDNLDFETVLAELASLDFVRKYTADGRTLGYVTNWPSYQYIGVKESAQGSIYPSPPENVPTLPQHVLAPDENIPERSNTFQNVPDTSKTIGVGVDLDVCASGSEGLSINPPNDGMNEPFAPSNSSDADIERLSAMFHEETDYPFKAGREQKPLLAALVQEHGLETVTEAVRVCAAESNHDWNALYVPASIFLKDVSGYVRIAKENLGVLR